MKKSTHTIPDLEKLINDKLDILQNGETKEEKRKARTEVIRLEKLIRDVNYKNNMGKSYDEMMHHSDGVFGLTDKQKKEVLALIDSVKVDDTRVLDPRYVEKVLDVTGVSVGSNRFTYKD